MRYPEMIDHVERVVANGLDHEGAERAMSATLGTLAQCLPDTAARNLAAQLPLEAQAPLAEASPEPVTFSVQEFLQRVADREGVSPSEALHHTRAVLDAVSVAVTGRQIGHVREELPAEFDTLFVPPAAANWPQLHRRRPHQ